MGEGVKVLSIFPAMLAALYIAVFEEILFRGFILAELCKATRPAFAVVIQAATFAVLHLIQTRLSVFDILALFLAACVLGYVTLTQRSLWPAIGGHMAWNFLTMTILGSPLSEKLLPPLVRLSDVDNLTQASVHTFSTLLQIAGFVVLAVILIWRNAKKYNFQA